MVEIVAHAQTVMALDVDILSGKVKRPYYLFLLCLSACDVLCLSADCCV